MFRILDGRSCFYQWDLDRKLIVDDETIEQVHFCNRTDDCSLVCEVYNIDGIHLVNVPNILLQTDWNINVYAYDSNYTKHSEVFKVNKRSKPADYVYTETECKRWEDLESRIEALEQSGGSGETVVVTDGFYYPSLSMALSDWNTDSLKNIVPAESAKVKCFYSDNGEGVIMLLDDVEVGNDLTFNRSVNLALGGHTLKLTTATAHLNFVKGNCAIWGNVEGSRIVKEGFNTTERAYIANVSCERLEVYGGEYKLEGTCDNSTNLFKVNSANSYCLFDGCSVYGSIHSTGATGLGTSYYQAGAIQNTGANTIIKGGNWVMNTSGNNRVLMFLNVGTLTAEGVEIVAESSHYAVAFNNDAANVGGTMKNGTFYIRDCNIKAHTTAETIYEAFGIINSKANTVCYVSDSTIFTDSRDFAPHENGLGTHAVAIDNAEGAYCYITNVTAHGTHSCLSNRGKMYVNGGRYTGFCHGGIYCSHGTEGEAFVNDAYLRDGYYEGIYTEHYANNKTSSVGGFYIGGGESANCSNMSAYFDNCKIEGVYRAFVMRGTSGEKNNKAYLSNCELIAGDVARAINIHEPFNTVYLTNCNYGKENATISNCVIYTDTIYRKSANDKDLNTIINSINELAKLKNTMIITLSTHDGGTTWKADKTFTEIKAAYNEGQTIVAEASGVLLSMIQEPDSGLATFSVNLTEFSIVVTIYADNTVEYLEILLSDLIPSGGLKQAAVITTTENANSIEVNGLNLILPITILVENAGTVVGDGLFVTVNGDRDRYNGYLGSVKPKGGEIWIYDNGEKMLGHALMSNTAINKYEWNISPETVITSIAITSPYHVDESKYYAAGTTLTIYEGVFPRVI